MLNRVFSIRSFSRLSAVFAMVTVMGLSLVTLPAKAQSDGIQINQIDVVGAQRIDPETILAYTPINVGDSVSSSDLNNVLSSLFSTDLFNDVSLEVDGQTLIITVDENPIINRIAIEGNDVLTDESLLQYLEVKPRRVFTNKLALETKATLIEIYRQSGRYAATIEPKIIELPDKRVDLIFEVDEGPLVKINKIKFIGNTEYSDRALKGVIQSRETKWYVLFTPDDKYDAGRLKLDAQQLRQFYLQNGFADIEIIQSIGELKADRTGFVLTFVIEEGGIYKIDNINITSDIEGVDINELYEANALIQGEEYDIRILEDSLSRITNKLGELGFAFVDVVPDIKLDKENLTLDVDINIGSARRNYVEAININGNDRTLDSVIRRQFELVEGDSFNQLRLTRSERSIRNLGYFSDVSVKVLPGSSSEQSVVDVEVDETATGSFQIGFGYSTFDKGSLSIGIKENNFLGTGRGARANLTVSDKKTNFRAGFTEPYLFDRNLLGSFDIFKQDNKYSDIKIEQQGAEFGVGFSAYNDYYHRLGYIIAETQTKTSKTEAASTSGDEGALLMSEVSYSLSQDKRDSRIDPREGYYWRLQESVAGLGGDVQYLRTSVKGQYLYPMFYKRAVLGFDAEAGLIDGIGEKVARSTRFLIGGRKVRGFDAGGIGPRDTGDNSAIGGNKYYVGSVNLISDLGLDPDLGVRWTVFADAGAVWDTDYPSGVRGANDNDPRTSFGYGFLWDTAIGPMSFFWAHPIDKQTYDKTRTFQFNFGGRF